LLFGKYIYYKYIVRIVQLFGGHFNYMLNYKGIPARHVTMKTSTVERIIIELPNSLN